MKPTLRVLLVEDSVDDAKLVLRELARHGWEVTHQRTENAAQFRAALAGAEWDAVLSDYALPQFSGTAAFQILKGSGRDLPFIFVSGTMGEDVAVAAMKFGAHDYVMKGNLARLAPAVERELRDAANRRQRHAAEAALRHVLRHARTIVMHGEVVAPAGWNPSAPGWSATSFKWTWQFQDEEAAREVLPLATKPGATYGESWEAAKFRDDLEPMAAVATKAFASGAASWRQEFRCVDRDGRVHWFTQAASIEPLGPGRWHVTTINTDITDRVQAEEALRTSEERLSTVFHLSPTSICIVRVSDQRIVEANEAFVRGTGYTREELIGRTPMELHLWEEPGEREAVLREVHEKGAAVSFKLRGRRKTGEIGVGLSSMARIALNGEEHLLSLIQDITELEHAEEARRESDQRLRQVTENLDEVFWLTDATKRKLIYVSPAYDRVWGRTSDSVYAAPQTWLDAVHPDDRERVRTAATLQANRNHELEYRIVRPDGAVRWIHERAFPIKGADGKTHQIAGVASDITERRQLEDQLRHTQKMESLGTLAGGIAHDFNNILTGMLGSAEVARIDLPADSPARPWIANVVTAGARAKELVQQILTFSRKHESKLVPRKIQADVNEAIRLLRSTIPSTVQLEARIDPACPPVVADATQIHQVVMNLCTNAWHALPERGGRIEVALAPAPVTPEMAATRLGLAPGPHVRLTVRDNGCGMPPETQQRIFEPFFTTKEQGRGTGLGLAVVHGIVQSHRGAISLQSTVGEGTCFEILLPALAAPTLQPATALDEPITNGHNLRILVVDDDGIALAALRGQLERAGYRVTAVSDPHAALKLFLTQPLTFDLVLTDSAMPGLSGLDLSEKILAVRRDVPVLLASGFFEPLQLEAARAKGIRDFVRKPVSLAELSKLVAQHAPLPPKS